MAHSDRDLSLDLLVFGPLPFRDGAGARHQMGVSIFYAELLPRLTALGHRVRVFAEAPAGGSAGPARVAIADEPGLRVHGGAFEYRSGRMPAECGWRESLRRELEPLFAQALSERRPDRVVVGREILAPVIVDLCRREGIPVVVVAHGVSLAMIERGAHRGEARAALVESLRAADLVIAVAHHLAASLGALGVEAVEVVPNGADCARFRPVAKDPELLSSLGLDGSEVVAAQISGLKPSKRPVDVVRAAAVAAERAPDLVHLVVGDGAGRREVETAARAEGVLERFRFAGEVDHDEMPRWTALADLVVVASEHEGMPLVFGEARAAGRVLIASDIAAAREAIVDGETGVLFRMGDVADLGEKLVALARDPGRRARIGARSRHGAERWTLDHATAALAASLRRAIR